MSSSILPSGEAGGFPAGVAAAEALEGLPVAGGPRFEAARVTAVTATTLRAALDLLLGELPPRRPIVVTWDDGALEVRCVAMQPEALAIAGGLMETVGGSLAQSAAGHPDWTLRVPVYAAHPMYLMLQQGTLALAVPWHSVIRVRMAPRESIAALARREGAAVLPPFVSVSQPADTRPAVLLGLGLKRAYLVADRLIWRMPADPVGSREPDSGGRFGPEVRTADGEIFQALDPIELLAEVEAAPLPIPRPAPVPAPARPVRSAASPRVAPPPATARARPGAALVLRELRIEDVDPLGAETPIMPPIARAPAPAPEPTPHRRPRPQARPAEPRALIAEDSIVGGIFLERLLARRGFAVEVVDGARDLEAALRRGRWDLVLVDVDLPDGDGADYLRRLGAENADRWVALVRDRGDERLAVAAGLKHCLRKPFESDPLDHLLIALGFGGPAT